MSRAITSLSKQQASVIPDNEGGSKAKVLRQMIEQLEKEKKEYLKTNQYLVQSTQQVCQENQTLKEEINNRKAYYEHILDRSSQSAKTLETEIDNNKKMSKIYHGYKNKVSTIQKTNPDPAYCSEMEKYEQELNDIEKSANDLLKRYYKSEKKVYDYQVLLSLDTRLNGINHVFTKEAQNCISANDSNPKLFSSSRLTRLQKRMSKGDEIKKDLSIEDGQIETEKLSTAKNTVDNISNELDRFLPIYNHITLINRQRMLMSEEEDLDYKTPAPSRATSKPSSPRHSSRATSNPSSPRHSSRSNGKDEPSYGSAVSKVPETVTWSDEISELRRIVGTDGFSYLNDSDRERQLRRIQGYFLPGKIPDDYPSYEESDESNKKGTSENDNRPPLSIKELEKLIAQPIKSDNSEKQQNSDNLDKDNNKSDNLNKDNNESEKLQKSDKNKSDNEKNEPLVTAKELEEIFNQPEEDPDNTKLSENGDDLDKSNKSEHSEKVKNSDKPNQSENGDQEDKSPKPSIFESLIRQGVQTDGCVKSNEAADKISKSVQTDPPQLHVDPLRSLLVHPEKGKKQPGESNGLKNAEEEEHASEFILDKSDEQPDEKDKRDQVSNPQQSEESTKSKQPEEPTQKPVDPSVSLLVHPTKDRQKLGTNQDQKNAEEEEHASEFILDKSEGHQEEEAHHSEKSVHSHKSEQSNKSKPEDKTEPPKLTVDPLISLLVHPTKDKEQSDTKNKQPNTEEEDHASEFILDKSDEQPDEKDKRDQVSNPQQSEESTKSKQPEEPTQKPVDPSVSLLVHPTKDRQKLGTNQDQKNAEEEEHASEFILDKSEGHQEEEIHNSEKSVHSHKSEQSNKSKQEDKTEPPKLTVDPLISLLVHPTKDKQQSDTKNKQPNTEEEDHASEFILDKPEEHQEEEMHNSEKSVHSHKSEQSNKSKQEEKTEPPKLAVDPLISLLVHPTKDRQKPSTSQDQKNAEEEDRASEFILEQSEKTINSEASSNTPKSGKVSNSAQTEPIDWPTQQKPVKPQKPADEHPYSLLVHPTKIRRKSSGRHSQRHVEEEDAASECQLYLSETQSEVSTKVDQPLIPPQTEEVVVPKKTEVVKPIQKKPQKPADEHPYSLLVHPTRVPQKPNYHRRVEEEETASEYLLLDQSETQSEITSKVDQLVKPTQSVQVTLPVKTETVKKPQKPADEHPNSLLVHPTKDRQQPTNYYKESTEEDNASEYMLDQSETQSEITNKVEHSVKSTQTEVARPEKTEMVKPPQKPSGNPNSLLVHPTKDRQPTTKYGKENSEEDAASEYLLDQSEVQSEITSKVDQLVKPPQTEQVTKPQKTETVKPPKKPSGNPNSLLVHPTKDRQQTTKYGKENYEEDAASEYLLDQSETQSEITSKVEQTVKSTQTEQATKPQKTETVKPPKKPSGNPNSLLVHPTKDRQPTTKYGKENYEEDAASEYLLDQSEAQSEITSKVEQLVKPPQTEQVTKPKKTETVKPPQKPSGNPNSLLVHPTKDRQPTTKYGKSNTEEDLASEYLLDQSEVQSEVTSKVEQLVKPPQTQQVTKPKKTETVKPPQKPFGNPNSLLVRPTKDRQQITKHNSCTAEEDLASEYLFDKIDEDSEIVSKKEKPVYTQHPSTVPKVEFAKPKPQAPVDHSVSLLVRPTNERRFADIPYKDATDEELLSEYLLEESETLPSKPRKKEAEHVDAQTNTKLPDVRSPETSKSSKTSPKVTKPVHQSTYDPSIFYTNSLSPTKPTKVVPLCTDKVPITVSLKDIGLEGLDSSTPGKTQELKMLQQLREEERKAKSRRGRNGSKYEYKRDEKLDPLSQGEVVCKLTSFEPSSSTRRSKMNSSKKKVASMTPYISLSYDERHESSGPCPKQASLLDSTHNAQKSQAIKPKTQQKSAPKVNMSNSGGFGENDLNGQVNRSPRRYNTAANDPGELQDLAGRLSAAVILDNVVE